MNTAIDAHSTPVAERFARRVVAQLDAGNADLPHDITERLRAARMQALARRKKEVLVHQLHTAPAIVRQGRSSAALGWGSEGGTWWRAVMSAIPVMALCVGLVVINTSQEDVGAAEVAEVDAALLTDDLPVAAYADPGFAQYLQTLGAQSTP